MKTDIILFNFNVTNISIITINLKYKNTFFLFDGSKIYYFIQNTTTDVPKIFFYNDTSVSFNTIHLSNQSLMTRGPIKLWRQSAFRLVHIHSTKKSIILPINSIWKEKSFKLSVVFGPSFSVFFVGSKIQNWLFWVKVFSKTLESAALYGWMNFNGRPAWRYHQSLFRIFFRENLLLYWGAFNLSPLFP